MSHNLADLDKNECDKVIQYQNECDDVLYEYWATGKVKSESKELYTSKSHAISIPLTPQVVETPPSQIGLDYKFFED